MSTSPMPQEFSSRCVSGFRLMQSLKARPQSGLAFGSDPSQMYSRPQLLSLILFSACILASAQAPPPPNLILEGKVQPTQNQTYIEAPFVVPDRTHRISVSFQNLGHDQHTVIDLGIADPDSFSWGQRRQQGPLHHQRDRCHALLPPRSDSSGPLEASLRNPKHSSRHHFELACGNLVQSRHR